MKIKDLASHNKNEIELLLSKIPFVKELKSQENSELHPLLKQACIVELAPGETIMRRGEYGTWIYFLIKGELSVFQNSDTDSHPISSITPGELFGDLAILCNHQRKATVAADANGKACQLFAIDFRPFGDLDNFSVIDLPTKLTFYRTIVHSVRWRLEVKRMEQASAVYASELRKVPTYTGEKGGMSELNALFKQSQFLADVLDRWNGGCGLIKDMAVVS